MSQNAATRALQTKLENLPAAPGVYQFKDSAGKVIYVGKAKNLKNRVRQYFHSRDAGTKTAVMVSKINDFELITTDSEIEALILELNLIKSLKPRYNVNLKDDKTYPYIVITNEQFPRVFPTRSKRTDGSRYFGPYTDVKNMRFALKSIRDIFLIRSCNLALTEEAINQGRFKDCLDHHIHKCDAPCVGVILKDEYNEMIKAVSKLLNGKTTTIISELMKKMDDYSGKMMFEQAARIRDKITALEVYSSKQKVVDEEIIDRDVFACEREDNDACGMVLKIRDGKVIGKSHFYLSNVLEKPDEELLENIITNYYIKAEFIPEEIFLDFEFDNLEIIKAWLEKMRDNKVNFIIPKIGEKAKLINMVKANARLMLNELKLAKLKKEFIAPSVDSLKRDLKMETLPNKIECFDISHIQGTDTVASLVVFQDGKPKKSEYKKFKIQTVLNETGQPDDFLSMREVVFRRYKRLLEENSKFPDLIVIDGGKGQLSSAVGVLTDLGIDIKNNALTTNYQILNTNSKLSTYVIGLAKRLEEVYFPNDPNPQTIPKTSSGLRLLQRVRDEAHRFAVTFHRSLRDKRTIHSELLDIKGVGEKTVTKLLTELGSIENIKSLITTDEKAVKNLIGKSSFKKLKESYNL